ncbi:hypothetical protein IU447_13485 [Nocardia farcinica]|uniref:Uncharacterized protein n=1 Tax=Nocardia farcinica TaxID=37329 RepID=A0A449GNA5_NOCFR|nr:hypothetical protein [Nocardia farcinica]MBF6361126.1 hypothetical protein [Nocardia farcinica]PFX02164.1 hypothetical protein CJ469_02609 [Nocardia farcinica]PFX08205.1 hypothetical protein CJ468_02754 [Nocardia farcinica]VFA94052.1 Uncharacterised protein [Nocardia farcinica]
MSEPLDVLEKSIAELRRAIRDASGAGDAERVGELRAQLRRAERAWDALIDADEPPTPLVVTDQPHTAPRQGMALPAREQVHQALMLLQAPAAPKLIVGVHEAFFPGDLSAAKLSSLRRDEERSYRAAPGARPYYLCPALMYDLLSPARALITISTWPLEQRIIGPLSPRVHFLTSAIRIAEAVEAAESTGSGPTPEALRLLWQFAANIPGALPTDPNRRGSGQDPRQVIDAAHTELDIHANADLKTRVEAARRARKQLSEAQCLFGAQLQQLRSAQAHA